MELSEVIIKPLVTEKATFLKESNFFTFKISPRANKILVKKAVEKKFSIDVEQVKILCYKKKKKAANNMRRRGSISMKSSFKKAYVRVKENVKIPELEI